MGVGGGPTAAGMGEGPGSGSPHSHSHSSREGECGTPTGELPPDAYYHGPLSLLFNITLTDRTRQEANVTCTGQDEMCRAILNDEWVSHPTWASKDTGFIAHKKNIYEDALHWSKEERHEYDFHIEAAMPLVEVIYTHCSWRDSSGPHIHMSHILWQVSF